MIQKFQINGLRWIHVTKPTGRDMEQVRNLFSFHPFVTESILSPTLHPLVEGFEDHLFLVLHFPIVHVADPRENRVAEVDFLITKQTLVTITYIDFPRLDTIYRTLKEQQAAIFTAEGHSGFLLHYIIDHLFQEHIKDLDKIEKEIMKVEKGIFQTRGRGLTVESISHIRRDIIDLRKPLRTQASVMTSFREKAEKFYGKQLSPYLLDLSVAEDRVLTLIESQRETMDMLYETYNSLLSARISRIIATLTIFSAVILPLSFLASIWGMNQKAMPLRDGPHDFWIVVGIMATFAFVLLLYFRKKQWL